MKTKPKKILTLSYLLVFAWVIIINIVVIRRPSLGQFMQIPIFKLSIAKIVILSSYPLYFALLYYLLSKGNKSFRDYFVIVFTTLTSIIIVLSKYFFDFLEAKNYPNYVYTKYHIHIGYFQDFSNFILVILIFITAWFSYTFVKKGQKKGLIKYLTEQNKIILIIAIIISLNSLVGNQKILMREIRSYLQTKDAEIEYQYRADDLQIFAKKMDFVRKNTEETAVILLPPQSWAYPDIGNQVLVRFFLYPRVLVSPKKIDEFLADYESKDCIVYSILSEDYQKKGEFYPDFKINVGQIILKRNDTSVELIDTKVFKGEYLDLGDFDIGLIKHQRCGI